MAKFDRRAMLTAGVGFAASAAFGVRAAQQSAEAPLGFTPDPAFVEKARALLARVPAVDLHAHPGLTFARGASDLTPEAQAIVAAGPFEEKAIADMKAGGLAGASFAAVADLQILGAYGQGIGASREFRPGEAQASYRRQIENLNTWVRRAGAEPALQPADFARLHRKGKIAALLTVEGGDFLAGDIGMVRTAFKDGVRSITIVHYHVNEIGDIQTAPATHKGLTPFGRDVVAEMERVGMIVDIAHAAEPVARDVLKVAKRPVMCSHTAIADGDAQNPRFISFALAKEIAANGGIIGAWPSGFAATTLKDFVDRIFRLAEAAGPQHAALGTDMDANFKPVMTSYRQLPLVVSELLRRGYGEAETAAFLGGNFLRVFQAVWAGRDR